MSSNWAVIVIFAIFVALLVWSFARRRGGVGNGNLDIALGIIANVEDCLRAIEVRLADPQSKQKFQNAFWKAFGRKTGFLGPELVATLTEAFTMAEEFNRRIDAARKSRMMSTLQDMPVEKLKGPMLKARDGLAAWIKASYQNQTPNRRGCLGF